MTIACTDVETWPTGYAYISIQRDTYADGSHVWFICNDWTGDAEDFDHEPTAEQILAFRNAAMA